MHFYKKIVFAQILLSWISSRKQNALYFNNIQYLYKYASPARDVELFQNIAYNANIM